MIILQHKIDKIDYLLVWQLYSGIDNIIELIISQHNKKYYRPNIRLLMQDIREICLFTTRDEHGQVEDNYLRLNMFNDIMIYDTMRCDVARLQ